MSLRTIDWRAGWLVNPWFDLFLVANLLWPLVALAMLAGPWASQPLTLLQVYFISTPHRWITLALVFLDRDHFWRQPSRFAGVGLLMLAIGLLLVMAAIEIGQFTSRVVDSLLFLMMLDFAWNAWHFAAQHAGIARIYGRLARPDLSPSAIAFEKWAIRGLVLWFFARWAITLLAPGEFAWLAVGDWLAVALPVVVLVRELATFRRSQGRALGRMLYIGSVTAVYAAQLAALRWDDRHMLVALVLAAAIFHAGEYLAIVGWSMRRKRGGVWTVLVPRTAVVIVTFMLALGVTAVLIDTRWAWPWTLATLLVSLLHYAYDGLIWRAKPATRTA